MSSETNETRRRILDAAWSLLESGDHAASMSDIAKAAGISRQAVYLHYPNRAELLIATTRHIDAVKDVDARLAESRAAKTGMERLRAFVRAWGDYIPEIHGVAKALMAMQETDAAAAAAWVDRMAAVRHGCKAVVDALKRDGRLAPEHGPKQATDLMFSLLSVHAWETLTRDCGWPQKRYIEVTTALCEKALVAKRRR